MRDDFAAWLRDHIDTECCDIVTVGRRTGGVHRVEIWFGVSANTMYFVSGNGPDADWYANAIASGTVEVHLGDQVRRGRARPVTDADERVRVGHMMAAKYDWDGDPSIGLTRQAWCYEMPVLALDSWA
jgi:deazaflavin-dependent oxidoreductase (nitroreductase family)